MRTLFFFSLIAIGACALAVAPPSWGADGARVETGFDADSVTVGQRVTVSYAASYPESLTLVPPEQFDPGNCRLLSATWNDRSSQGYHIKQVDLVLLPMDLEGVHVPPAAFRFLRPAGDTLVVFSDAVEIPVRLQTAADSPPHPLKPQWEAPKSYLPYLVIGGIAVLVALLVWLWWRRRKAKPVAEPSRPQLPADYVALKALGEIEAMRLLESGRHKKYYTLVVDVLRHYIEQRYGVQAMDRTTDEIVFDLQRSRIEIDALEPLLRDADLVKFAKYKPGAEKGSAALESARDIVVQTTPRPVVATGGE